MEYSITGCANSAAASRRMKMLSASSIFRWSSWLGNPTVSSFAPVQIQLEFAKDHKKTRLPVISRGRVEFKPGFIANLAHEPGAPEDAHICAMLQQQVQQVLVVAKFI